MIFDIRSHPEFLKKRVITSEHFDIGTWEESSAFTFSRASSFKHFVLVGSDSVFKSSDFDSFLESLLT